MRQLSLFDAAPMQPPDDWPLISTYSRVQALEDGVLVDVSDLARRAGFKYPTAITQALHARLQPSEHEASWGQSYEGRLWDVLWMGQLSAQRARSDHIPIVLYIAEQIETGQRLKHNKLRLLAVCGPGDSAEPVITIGFPEDF